MRGAGVDPAVLPADVLDEDLGPGAPHPGGVPRPPPGHAGRGVGVRLASDDDGVSLPQGDVLTALEGAGDETVRILVLHLHHGDVCRRQERYQEHSTFHLRVTFRITPN